jgi:hypothetical protein
VILVHTRYATPDVNKSFAIRGSERPGVGGSLGRHMPAAHRRRLDDHLPQREAPAAALEDDAVLSVL